MFWWVVLVSCSGELFWWNVLFYFISNKNNVIIFSVYNIILFAKTTMFYYSILIFLSLLLFISLYSCLSLFTLVYFNALEEITAQTFTNGARNLLAPSQLPAWRYFAESAYFVTAIPAGKGEQLYNRNIQLGTFGLFRSLFNVTYFAILCTNIRNASTLHRKKF